MSKKCDIYETCYELVSDFFEGNQCKADLWFKTPNPAFGGITPEQLYKRTPRKLLNFVQEAVEANAKSTRT